MQALEVLLQRSHNSPKHTTEALYSEAAPAPPRPAAGTAPYANHPPAQPMGTQRGVATAGLARACERGGFRARHVGAAPGAGGRRWVRGSRADRGLGGG